MSDYFQMSINSTSKQYRIIAPNLMYAFFFFLLPAPYTCICMVFNAAATTQEEEYVLVADYVTDTEGELSVSAGDVVQLINREATGIML